jgi:hypothetical protein
MEKGPLDVVVGGRGRRVGLFLVLQSSLVHLIGIRGLLSGVAAANREDQLLANAAAGDARAHNVRELTGQKAGVNLQLAAHAAPAHTIIVPVTTL